MTQHVRTRTQIQTIAIHTDQQSIGIQGFRSTTAATLEASRKEDPERKNPKSREGYTQTEAPGHAGTKNTF